MFVQIELIPTFREFISNIGLDIMESKGQEAFRFFFLQAPVFAMKEPSGISMKSSSKDLLKELESQWMDYVVGQYKEETE